MKEQERTFVVRSRPPIQELQYHLYGRAIHPELIQSYQFRIFERGNYLVRIDLIPAGHVVRWTLNEKLTLSELVTCTGSPLPVGRRIATFQVRGRKKQELVWRHGIRYHSGIQVEAARTELLWEYQQLCQTGCQGMFQAFGQGDRMSMGGMSYIHVETRNRSMIVQSIHTYPDDGALVKVESYFQAP
jgi:hypothetical protein